ncbi:4-hydroxy-tetrahydrodipicolinate reductase [Acuticoccus mangrovi]|nr:4-hydroxy-tetrahydrodipicolinate reductase [Acuticoccus mangrovi]
MRVGVVGAAGRMGRAVVRAVSEDDGARLAVATERPGAADLGADVGTLAGLGPNGVMVGDDPAAFAACDVVLDFTAPATSVALAAALAELGTAHVIGTTGFSAEQDVAIAGSAQKIAIVKSGNMSLGLNLLAALVRRATRALPDADIEVLEMHHRRKVDAPSGTALMLGEAAAAGRDIALRENAVFVREGQTGPREAGTIGFATLRGGTVIGEHEVILALDSERVRLGHIAEDRTVFARGAIKAGHWVIGRPPGLYKMTDVLGLED